MGKTSQRRKKWITKEKGHIRQPSSVSSFTLTIPILAKEGFMKNNFPTARDIKSHFSPQDFYESEQGIEICSKGNTSWAIAGLCPFHSDTRPGSFYIHKESGAYKCHSCGASGGDIIDFKMRTTGASFPQVLLELARRCL